VSIPLKKQTSLPTPTVSETTPAGKDKVLVKRMLAGDERAFEEFFAAYFPGLYRFALLRVESNGDAAEEVAQATLCAAIEKIESYRGEAPLFSWLCTFCRHEISAFYSKQKRKPVSLGLVEDSELQAVLDSLISSDAQGPEDVLKQKELAQLVRVALDRLPPHYGDALEWKYIEDVSVNEIASRLKMGSKAAESLLTRAREAFRECFASVCGGKSEML